MDTSSEIDGAPSAYSVVVALLTSVSGSTGSPANEMTELVISRVWTEIISVMLRRRMAAQSLYFRKAGPGRWAACVMLHRRKPPC